MSINTFNIKGLQSQEVLEAREKFGENKLVYKKENTIWEAIKNLVKEPMIMMLLSAAAIYFISGKSGDGFFMTSAIVIVSAISLIQDSRSRNALQKLKKFTQSYSKVIRNGNIEEIRREDLVIGDSIIIEEGNLIPADATIIHSNDFSVNESILTGESFSVFKDATSDSQIFLGTTVVSGLAIANITAIGNTTKLGNIGKSIEEIKEEKTPLELQINNFVKKMVIIGAIVFIIVWIINYTHSKNILDSLLKALTLAMSILPEEIPVAFTTFMALGAWRLMKMGIIVKQMKTIETLGSATVICTDKTGTITENKMSLAKLYLLSDNQFYETENIEKNETIELIKIATFASEPIPFDPMEVALHETYTKFITTDERLHYKMIFEYPLSGKPPMMTHIFEDNKSNRIIAAKGAPEAFLNICNLTIVQQELIIAALNKLAEDGYRVLAIATTTFLGNEFPKTQQAFIFSFKGMIAFYDPPKKNIQTVLKNFYNAGISVKIITGDNAATTTSIAKQVGFRNFEKNITGDALMKLDQPQIEEIVINTNIFTRMFPDAKMKIINALKAKKEIVAMTGDGVNDGPALKAAHIGIAMGKKGTEIAKGAAALILLEDDLSKMVEAIAMGRKIYTNLKKAIQYIISIHIPIILTVFVPLVLGWKYPNIFSPVHIIFLELIMGPTCSIIYENEPIELNTMLQKPRPFTTDFFNWKELITSIIQGVMIALGTLGVYQFAVYQGFNEAITRTMVFAVLITANIFLTLVNRSFYFSIITTLRYKNNLVGIIIVITIAISALLLFIQPLTRFFEFHFLNLNQIIICLAIGFVCVIWYEIIKWIKRIKN
jgi:Ca2+-transporting ATPase